MRQNINKRRESYGKIQKYTLTYRFHLYTTKCTVNINILRDYARVKGEQCPRGLRRKRLAQYGRGMINRIKIKSLLCATCETKVWCRAEENTALYPWEMISWLYGRRTMREWRSWGGGGKRSTENSDLKLYDEPLRRVCADCSFSNTRVLKSL